LLVDGFEELADNKRDGLNPFDFFLSTNEFAFQTPLFVFDVFLKISWKRRSRTSWRLRNSRSRSRDFSFENKSASIWEAGVGRAKKVFFWRGSIGSSTETPPASRLP
jgi:hypothetical protein